MAVASVCRAEHRLPQAQGAIALLREDIDRLEQLLRDKP
jgi:hypothetical protein